MKALPCDWSDVFPGGVPGWVIFGMQAKDIRSLLSPCCGTVGSRDLNLAELSLIGLIAYFEGFVRYHFASCVNICPKLLSRFARARPEIVIPLRDIADMDSIHGCVGFILADGLGFTSPKEINAQFRDLLGIIPFSKKECAIYDGMLHDRHQIVHSAGMYTTKYLRARGDGMAAERNRVYMDSVVITSPRAIEAADFLLTMAEKIVRATDVCLADPANWHSSDEMVSMKEHRSFFKWTSEAFAPEELEDR
jgi:hypothetical protein